MVLALDSPWVIGSWILGNMTNSSFHLMVGRSAINSPKGAKTGQAVPKVESDRIMGDIMIKHGIQSGETSLRGGAGGW